MNVKTLILTAFILGVAFSANAQEEIALDEWQQDFNSRRDAALTEYRNQGLESEEIRERMSTFREESQRYREENGIVGSGDGNRERVKDGSGDMNRNQSRLKDGTGDQKRSGSRPQDGSGQSRGGGGGR